MATRFTTAPDGNRVAYDRQGNGPVIVLVHGGGGSRQEWHAAGYVARLVPDFTVITVDLRGHGESGQPTDPAAYAVEKLGEDIRAAADACGADRFAIWGMSFGGNVSRYLAAASDRVSRLAVMGTKFGPGASGEVREDVLDFCARWPPVLQAQEEGRFDPKMLSEEDQAFMAQFNVPIILAWGRAMLDWPDLGPEAMRCPTLWLAGAADAPAVASMEQYAGILPKTRVMAQVLQGLDHNSLFEEIDRVFPLLVGFTKV